MAISMGLSSKVRLSNKKNLQKVTFMGVSFFSVWEVSWESMTHLTFISGFTFAEFGCIRTRNTVTCCHFSSDGKLLASAGDDKKVICLHNEDRAIVNL